MAYRSILTSKTSCKGGDESKVRLSRVYAKSEHTPEDGCKKIWSLCEYCVEAYIIIVMCYMCAHNINVIANII